MRRADREYIYGVHPVTELVRAGRRKVYKAWVAEGDGEGGRLRKIRSVLEHANIPCEVGNKRLLFDLCASTENQGAVAETTPYPYTPFKPETAGNRLLLLDNVEDPQNVGAILRSAEIFGWTTVLLANRGVPLIYASVVKASAGATEYLNISQDHSANAYVRALKKEDYTVVALDAKGQMPLDQVPIQTYLRLLLVIGGEHRAVGQFILNLADAVVAIPQKGHIQSLNASVAAAITLFSLGQRT